MGILNVTPDSFSDGGQHNELADALAFADEMAEQGAHIIDVGGESTRPGSDEVSIDEELRRVLPVVKVLAEKGYCVSIDTRHAEVARQCVEAGASIINDVSGFRDCAMVEVAAKSTVGCVVMHMAGDPKTMQENPHYTDVVAEVKAYLAQQACMLKDAGVDASRICIDPGPGFGKTPSQSMELMRNMHELVRLGYPVMVAVSRKSVIGWAYHIDDPMQRDVASAAEALQACELGASVIRTHNVQLTADTVKDLRPYVLLGLGANVALVANEGEETEGKIANLEHAIGALCTLPDTQIIDISSYYESEPAYYEDQDTFINAVVLCRTGIPPKELLGYLHAIENSLGRVREIENGPRTCDIDILDYQMYVTDNEILTLPHPGICERDFVMQPLLELLPHHVLANDKPVVPAEKVYGAAKKIS